MRFDSQLLIGLLPGVFFFIIIPLVGAFAVRSRWRNFRRKVLRAYTLPELDYASAHPGNEETLGPRLLSFRGRLEGIQGDTGIWLGAKGISVMVDLDRVPIFLLPQAPKLNGNPPDATPRVVMWREMNALVEGSRFFVAGEISRDSGSLIIDVWSGNKGTPLVIMYDCPDGIVLDRAMWTGRQRNEYWNHITPISLIVGFLAELVWVMQVFDLNRLYALVGTVAALVPVLPLLPPGVGGYYVYRRLWRWARRIRATRDMTILHNESATRTKETRRYTIQAGVRELAALFFLVLGLGVNAYIAAVILAIVLR